MRRMSSRYPFVHWTELRTTARVPASSWAITASAEIRPPSCLHHAELGADGAALLEPRHDHRHELEVAGHHVVAPSDGDRVGGDVQRQGRGGAQRDLLGPRADHPRRRLSRPRRVVSSMGSDRVPRHHRQEARDGLHRAGRRDGDRRRVQWTRCSAPGTVGGPRRRSIRGDSSVGARRRPAPLIAAARGTPGDRQPRGAAPAATWARARASLAARSRHRGRHVGRDVRREDDDPVAIGGDEVPGTHLDAAADDGNVRPDETHHAERPVGTGAAGEDREAERLDRREVAAAAIDDGRGQADLAASERDDVAHHAEDEVAAGGDDPDVTGVAGVDQIEHEAAHVVRGRRSAEGS